MPKEIVYRTGTNCFADAMVRWDKQGQGVHSPGQEDARVDLFMISQSLSHPKGSFMFEPEDPEQMGLPSGSKVGPVYVDLNREQINRLIKLLRKARDQAYGPDA